MNQQAKTTADNLPWTVLRLLNWTADFFRVRGSDTARLDAEVLLAHALDCERIQLYTTFGDVPEEAQLQTFRQLVRRRGEGVPVAYLVGYREFYALKLQVTPDVLIPRPETEHLVIKALDHAKTLASVSTQSSRPPLRIADVGTGSGAIAITVAKHLDSVYPAGGTVVAIDISAAALQVAQRNASDHQLDQRIEFFEGDLLLPLPSQPCLDMILSNPPYVSQAEYDALAPTVRDHEPAIALLAGPRGTEVFGRLVTQAAERLRGGAPLMVEISPMIADDCAAIFSEHGGFGPATFTKDLAGHRRVISAVRR